MPIKIGGTNITDIKLGTTQITKVYLGSTLVWNKAAAPTLISAETNTAGTIITLTFNKAMADPMGKHGEFSTIVERTAEVWYYGYPELPTNNNIENLPYRVIATGRRSSGIATIVTALFCGSLPLYNVYHSLYGNYLTTSGSYYRWILSNGVWTNANLNAIWYNTIERANNDIYTNSSRTTVLFEPTGGAGGTISIPATSISLNSNTIKLDLYLQTPILASDTIELSYAKGTIMSADGFALESFGPVEVTNLVA